MSRVYDSRWARAAKVFLDQHPLCVMCERQGVTTAASVVDHIRPHRIKDALAGGDEQIIAAARRLFWDKANWQPLCKVHHDSTKQRIEKRGIEIGCGEDGLPIDPRHHWSSS